MLNPLLAKLMAETRIADLRANAARFPARTSNDPPTADRASRVRRLLDRAKARTRIAKPAAAVSGDPSQSQV